MHAGMALVRAVGPDKFTVDILIRGGLQLVMPRRDVLDLQVLKH